VNWHQLIDERSYEMHQVVARVLREDPKKLELVVTWIREKLSDSQYSDSLKNGLSEWLRLIELKGVTGVLEALADRSEEAVRLRHNSPFAVIMPQDERGEILRRYETLRTRTHSPGF